MGMTEIDLGYDYDKLCSSLRGYFQGARYYGALITLDHARAHHCGLRKDGRPEFSHQIMQASYLRTLEANLRYPELTYITVLAHDLDEDHEVNVGDSIDRIVHGVTTTWMNDHERYLPLLETSLDLMNKVREIPVLDALRLGMEQRVKKPTETYYGEIANDPIASVAKGLDRDHNISTMLPPETEDGPGFAEQKLADYEWETDTYVIPMLKQARKLFPSQEPVYQNLKHLIRRNLFMVRRLRSALNRK